MTRVLMLRRAVALILYSQPELPSGPFGVVREWEQDVAAFEAADRTSPPPKNALLFVGSSTIVRWKTLDKDFPNQPIINRGFGGNEIADSTHFADRMIFPYRAEDDLPARGRQRYPQRQDA